MNKVVYINDIFREQYHGEYPYSQLTEGFFKTLWTLDIVDESYTDESGNPLQTWTNDANIIVPQLDFNYLSRSAKKICRPFIWKQIITGEPNEVAEGEYFSNEKKVVEYITRQYSKKWLDIWKTMFYEYNPIENYNMVENLDDVSRLQHGKTETVALQNVTHTRSGQEVDTPAVTTTNTEQIYGFDATNAQNANKTTISNTGTNTHEYQNVTDVDTGSTLTTNAGTDTTNHEYELTRSGNIGVTTSQQMITQERELLMFNYFDDIVFPDIDKVLTLQVY